MAVEDNFKMKPVILIICNYYLPGYKSGALRTLAHMVERFKDKFDFRVITFDHDSDKTPYENVEINKWNKIDGATVFYLSKDKIKLSTLRELVKEIKPQAIYLNSVFSILSVYLLVLKKLKAIPPQVKIILAPEGELSDGALQLKAVKKSVFTKIAKTLNLYEDLIWKTTAEPEKHEAQRFKGSGGKIFIAPNLPSRQLLKTCAQDLKPEKKIGEAKMIFLSRYMRKKNFKWLLDNLDAIEGKLEIDIFGPIEDKVYWDETRKTISGLPANVKVCYRGSLPHYEAIEKLLNYHFFILPTLGENFGHVFIEALAAGCPLITSDRTPWRDLETKKIGWDLPLEKPEEWNKIIKYCLNINDINYRKVSGNARKFAYQWLSDPKIEENTLTVLQHSLESTST